MAGELYFRFVIVSQIGNFWKLNSAGKHSIAQYDICGVYLDIFFILDSDSVLLFSTHSMLPVSSQQHQAMCSSENLLYAQFSRIHTTGENIHTATSRRSGVILHVDGLCILGFADAKLDTSQDCD